MAMAVSPYTKWGVEHEHLRADVADILIALPALSIGSLTGAAAILFSTPRNRKGWFPMVLALLMLFLISTAVWRLIWVRYYVLG